MVVGNLDEDSADEMDEQREYQPENLGTNRQSEKPLSTEMTYRKVRREKNESGGQNVEQEHSLEMVFSGKSPLKNQLKDPSKIKNKKML